MLVKAPAKLEANHRYHWRVRAITSDGRSSAWSPAQSFWWRAATPPPPPPFGEAPALTARIPRPEKKPSELSPLPESGNLARTAMTFAQPNYWEGAGEATDGNVESSWVPDAIHGDEGRKARFPGWWAARFDKDETVKQVDIVWTPGKPAKDFAVQTWDGKAWQDQKAVTGNKDARSTIALPQPTATRAVRVRITAPATDTTGIAEIDIR
jgi:hypothetical protein